MKSKALVVIDLQNDITKNYKVLSDCITSYDKNKLPEMIAYYEGKGCKVSELCEFIK